MLRGSTNGRGVYIRTLYTDVLMGDSEPISEVWERYNNRILGSIRIITIFININTKKGLNIIVLQ